MRRETWLALALLAVVLGAMMAKSLLVSVPPVRSEASQGQFDAPRAKARLARILADERPHPVDSPAGDAVRARLIGELRAMGISPVVRNQFACNAFRDGRLVACARVRNVLATIGPESGKALLLSAHYDSTPVGPGAADAGVGVATLLEVASLLKDQPLRRPITLLFNEGEEFGLLGARAFLADPASRGVDSMLNFEARGVTGPATMFETSRPNAAAVNVLARSAERPFASSLMTDVYRLMPNDTDVSIFKERGWLTLNFAMAGNETRYHSAGDNLAALDGRSLQHMGDQALAAASLLATGTPKIEGERIFVDVLGRWLVLMPLWLGLIMLGVLVASFALLAWRRRALVREPGAILIAILLAAGVAWLGSVVVGALRPGSYWRAHQDATLLAVYASALLAALIALRSLADRSSQGQLRAAFWLLFLLFGAGLATVAPGAIIYFLAPPVAVLLGGIASRWHRSAAAVGGGLGWLLLYLTWGEMLALLEVLLSPGPLWLFAPLGAVLIIPALIELQPLLRRASRRSILGGAGVLALAGWFVSGLAPAYSMDRQQIFTIEHVTAFPERRSHWAVLNDFREPPDGFAPGLDWTLATVPHSERKRWIAPAPAASLQAPSVQVLARREARDERQVQVRLSSKDADTFVLRAPADAAIRAAGIGGQVRPLRSDGSGLYMIRCAGRGCDGQVWTLVIGKREPITVTVAGVRFGLPDTAAPLLAARPRFARPQYAPDQTIAVTELRM